MRTIDNTHHTTKEQEPCEVNVVVLNVGRQDLHAVCLCRQVRRDGSAALQVFLGDYLGAAGRVVHVHLLHIHPVVEEQR